MFKVICVLLSIIYCFSSKAAGFTHIYFENQSHHFGFVYEGLGEVHCQFTFQNTGNKALKINKITSDCGCTSAVPSKYTILPKDTGSILVTFNPLGRKGTFSKKVNFFSNAMQEKISLTLTGQIIPMYQILTDSISMPKNLILPTQKNKKHGKR